MHGSQAFGSERWAGARRSAEGDRGAGRGVRIGWLLLAVVLAVGAPSAARAESTWSEAGVSAGAVLVNFVYMPAKLTYALAGLVVTGAAYALSGGDRDVAGPILDAALRGDYVVTPDHLRGRDDLEFIGRRRSHAPGPAGNPQRDPYRPGARGEFDDGY